ncbi:hypothetical protein GOP47_0026254 [Adiantum capillus-veneris]|nr:hypothetical protein GOP47_0026254 [Adiantum capillus-veneris]
MGRAPCCEKDSVKRGPWTPEEDAKLLACIGQYGTGSWRTLPKKAGLQRCGKSCRLRWTNYLRPDLKHGRFSEQEEQLIVKLHAALGSRWSLIAAQLPGRTDNDVKNYWNTRLKKKLCEMGIDPITHKPISQLLADLAGSMTIPKGSEIAEATLGCFKDDMLNVLMRRRSSDFNTSSHSQSTVSTTSTTTTATHNYNVDMSFAPLDVADLHHVPNNFTSTPATAPNNSLLVNVGTPTFGIPYATEPHLINSYATDPHLINSYVDTLCTAASYTPLGSRSAKKVSSNCSRSGAPCGPVSGIRSAVGAAIAAHSQQAEVKHSLNLLNKYKTVDNAVGPEIMVPTLHSSLAADEMAHDHHNFLFSNIVCGNVDPTNSRSNMLLDHASYVDLKEVPDLNLTHMSRAGIPGRPGPSTYLDVIPAAAADDRDHSHFNQAVINNENDVGNPDSMQRAVSDMQMMASENPRMYTLLLQQQEKHQKDVAVAQQLAGKAVADDDEENIVKPLNVVLSVNKENINIGRTTRSSPTRTGTAATTNYNNMEKRTLQWSPASYTNSGSSSSNLSLSMNPHISALDSVLTSSDSLLWDLSEFGSMVS